MTPARAIKPDQVERLVQLLRMGNYVETAAIGAGIPRQTLLDWLKKGNANHSPQHVEFYERVMGAIAEGELLAVAAITRAGRTDWTALAWRLERMFPRRYGRMRPKGPDGAPESASWQDGEAPAASQLIDRDDIRNKILQAASKLEGPGESPHTIEGGDS